MFRECTGLLALRRSLSFLVCTEGTRKPRNTFNQAEQGWDLRLRKVTRGGFGGEQTAGRGRGGGGQVGKQAESRYSGYNLPIAGVSQAWLCAGSLGGNKKKKKIPKLYPSYT